MTTVPRPGISRWFSIQSCVAIALSVGCLTIFRSEAFAQDSIWSSYNEIGIKMYEDKEYDQAEKFLVDAVREAEKLSGDNKKLLTSLRALRKLYIAMGKSSQRTQIESRLRSLGERYDTEGGGEQDPSKLTEDPASDPTLKNILGEDFDGKGLKRTTDESTKTDTNDKPREREFTISTASDSKPEELPTEHAQQLSQPVEDTRRLASAGGIPDLLGGSKRAEEVLRLVGHTGYLKTIDISADGNRALTGAQDNSIRYWNLKTGKEIKTFEGHEDDVNSVVFSPVGNSAASAGSDKTVRIWDLDLGTELKKLEGHQNLVTCVAFSEGGGNIVSGGYDGTVRVWDATTGKAVKVFEGNLGTVRCVAFTPDGDQVVSGGTDKAVTLWSLRDGKAIRKFAGHKNDVTGVLISRDGTKLLSWSRDLTMQLWDLSTGEPIKLLQGHENWIQRAMFLSDDKLISGSLDKTIRLWDLNTGKEIESYKVQPFGMWCVGFTKKGDYCLTGSDDYSTRVWLLP